MRLINKVENVKKKYECYIESKIETTEKGHWGKILRTFSAETERRLLESK